MVDAEMVENARSVFRAAVALRNRAFVLNAQAEECRREAERLDRIGAAWTDGRNVEDEL